MFGEVEIRARGSVHVGVDASFVSLRRPLGRTPVEVVHDMRKCPPVPR